MGELYLEVLDWLIHILSQSCICASTQSLCAYGIGYCFWNLYLLSLTKMLFSKCSALPISWLVLQNTPRRLRIGSWYFFNIQEELAFWLWRWYIFSSSVEILFGEGLFCALNFCFILLNPDLFLSHDVFQLKFLLECLCLQLHSSAILC